MSSTYRRGRRYQDYLWVGDRDVKSDGKREVRRLCRYSGEVRLGYEGPWFSSKVTYHRALRRGARVQIRNDEAQFEVNTVAILNGWCHQRRRARPHYPYRQFYWFVGQLNFMKGSGTDESNTS